MRLKVHQIGIEELKFKALELPINQYSFQKY